mmetsp:Transcript_8948/g.23986  ORF Transcript_8948/g.23986 Transcript_8948/m.23986 type:complete len:484 (+) Transcript_8948:432-1883(+)
MGGRPLRGHRRTVVRPRLLLGGARHRGEVRQGLDLLLLRLLDLHPQHDGVVLYGLVEAAEVRPTEVAGLHAVRTALPLVLPDREPAAQRDAGGAVQEEGAVALSGAFVARGVEDELQAINASRLEGRAAKALPLGEELLQLRGLIEPPIDVLHHSRSHPVHLVLHKFQRPVVHVPVSGHGASRVQRNLVRGLQDLETYAKGVILLVQLLPEDADLLGDAARLLPYEGVLHLPHGLADVQLEDQVEAGPRVEEKVAVAFAIVARAMLQLQHEVERAGGLESVGAPSQRLLRRGGLRVERSHDNLPNDVSDDPFHASRRDVGHRGHEFPEFPPLRVHLLDAIVHHITQRRHMLQGALFRRCHLLPGGFHQLPELAQLCLVFAELLVHVSVPLFLIAVSGLREPLQLLHLHGHPLPHLCGERLQVVLKRLEGRADLLLLLRQHGHRHGPPHRRGRGGLGAEPGQGLPRRLLILELALTAALQRHLD